MRLVMSESSWWARGRPGSARHDNEGSNVVGWSMSSKDLILDFSAYDLNHCLADLEEIRRWNPQRFEMEQLTAIVHEDVERNVCVGYRDYGENEFWIRGHMPGRPVLPGILMCEAAAQLCGYFATKHNLMGARFWALAVWTESAFATWSCRATDW